MSTTTSSHNNPQPRQEESTTEETAAMGESFTEIFSSQPQLHKVLDAEMDSKELGNTDDQIDDCSPREAHLRRSSSRSARRSVRGSIRGSFGRRAESHISIQSPSRAALMSRFQIMNSNKSKRSSASASSEQKSRREVLDLPPTKKIQKKISTETLEALDRSVHGLNELQEKLSIFGGDNKDCPEGSDEDNPNQLDIEEFGFKLGDPLHRPFLHDDGDDEYGLSCSEQYGKMRDQCGAIVNSWPVQWLVTILIIANALLLGVMTFYLDDATTLHKLNKADLALLICFTVEIGFQLFYLGRYFFRYGWLVFDFIIITISWIFQDGDLQILRSFRILRALALLSRWSSLRSLIQALTRTLPNMGNIAVVLVLILYVFCVLFTNLYHDLYFEGGNLDYDYFGSLDKTFLTLFQFMTLDSWTGVVRQVQEDRPASMIGFLVFVIITAFFCLNLVVAVICESLIELNRIREQKSQRSMMKQQKTMMEEQTQQLLTQTHEVVLLQQKMMANQLAMQRLLMELARHHTRQDDGDEPVELTGSADSPLDSSSPVMKGKGGLQQVLKEVERSSILLSFEDADCVDPAENDAEEQHRDAVNHTRRLSSDSFH